MYRPIQLANPSSLFLFKTRFWFIIVNLYMIHTHVYLYSHSFARLLYSIKTIQLNLYCFWTICILLWCQKNVYYIVLISLPLIKGLSVYYVLNWIKQLFQKQSIFTVIFFNPSSLHSLKNTITFANRRAVVRVIIIFFLLSKTDSEFNCGNTRVSMRIPVMIFRHPLVLWLHSVHRT